MQVLDIVEQPARLQSVRPSATLADVLMHLTGVSSDVVVVSDDGVTAMGYITGRDAAYAISQGGDILALAQDVMNDQVFEVQSATPVDTVLKLMIRRSASHVLVVDEAGFMAGVVPIGDVVRACRAAGTLPDTTAL
jgi:CBS domain-containing protein